MNESICIQGTVKLVPIKCNELPFSLSTDGRILYNKKVFLTKTKSNLFGTHEISWGTEVGNILVKAFNDAYKAGYEKDRYE